MGGQTLEELLAEAELVDARFDGAHLTGTDGLRSEGEDDGGVTPQQAAVRGLSQLAGERVGLGALARRCSQVSRAPHLHLLGDDAHEGGRRLGDVPGVLVGARSQVLGGEDEELVAAVDHLEVGEGLDGDRALGGGDVVAVAEQVELVHREHSLFTFLLAP